MGKLISQRTTDRKYHFTGSQIIAIAKRNCLQVIMINFQHGNVTGGVCTNNFCIQLFSIKQSNFNFIGIINHMIVRDDISFLRYDHSRPKPLTLKLSFLVQPWIIKKEGKWRLLPLANRLGSVNCNHSWIGLFSDLNNSAVKISQCPYALCICSLR